MNRLPVEFFAEVMAFMLRQQKQLLDTAQESKAIVSSIDELLSDSANMGKRPRVLLGTMEIADQLSHISKGLNEQGALARTLNYYPTYLKYESDYVYDVTARQNPENMRESLERIAQQAMKIFDVFHFSFGTSLLISNQDLPQLRHLHKKVVMNHFGSDVRLLSVARTLNPYAVAKTRNEDSLKRKMEQLSQWIDYAVVADAELFEYVKGYYKNTHIIRLIIDPEVYKPDEFFQFRRQKPIVVHAPTSSYVKGTKFVLKAVEELKNHIDFEFILVQNMSHQEALQVYRQADIIVDQLQIGSYGMLSLEGMSMGKPVITWISEFMKGQYPKELPLVSANPNTVQSELERLLMDPDLRADLGKKGRQYVLDYHDQRKIAQQLLSLYNSIE